jgi:hypothetical protein
VNIVPVVGTANLNAGPKARKAAYSKEYPVFCKWLFQKQLQASPAGLFSLSAAR